MKSTVILVLSLLVGSFSLAHSTEKSSVKCQDESIKAALHYIIEDIYSRFAPLKNIGVKAAGIYPASEASHNAANIVMVEISNPSGSRVEQVLVDYEKSYDNACRILHVGFDSASEEARD